MPIYPNTVLGRYKIRSTIGTGGMGEVFLAEDTELERLAAVKVLLDGVSNDSESSRRFVQEAKAASALNHPNILTIYEIGVFEDARFIAAEFIKGETLRQRLKNGPLSLGQAVDVAIQVAAALEAAHGVGIVHRDIKPENIMLRDDGLVKVLDFGLAKLIPISSETVDSEGATIAQVKTMRGALVGTVNYMSPEQARAKEVDTRSDIWSLGVVLYEMLTLRSPFAGETASDTIASILRGDPPPLPSHFPPDIGEIVSKALCKDLADRYQNIRDMYIDLRTLKREFEFSDESGRLLIDSDTGLVTVPRLFTGLQAPGQRTGQASVQVSSAEYLVSQISKHKRAWLGTLGALVALLAAVIVYFAVFAPASPQVDSLAVMPFENVGGSEENEYLTDGLSEALINNLSQLPQLKVIARTSTFKYKGTQIDPAAVARDLGVRALLVGRVIRRNDTYQISVELINAENNSQIWGDSYNRRVNDLQDLQQEIVSAVSQKLQLKLSGDQQQQIAKDFTRDPEAYQYYLNGVFYARKRGVENVKRALEYFDRAIERDPNFALAYVGRASAYNLMVGSDLISPADGKARAKASVERALQLDDKLAEAHFALARARNNELDWTGAESSYRRAIELSPSLVSAHTGYAFYLSVVERHDESLALIRRAGELDPLSPGLKSTEGGALYLARRYGEAISVLEKCIADEPDDTFALAYLALSYGAVGRYDDALRALQKSAEHQGDTTSTQLFVGRIHVLAGRAGEARAILQRLRSTDQYVAPGELATLYAALGDKDNAFAELEKAFNTNDLQLQFLRVDPAFDTLRNDSRYADLIKRMNFPTV